MNKYRLRNILGILGITLWSIALLIRDTGYINNPSIMFICGIAPNIGAPCLFTAVIELIFYNKCQKEFTFKHVAITLIIINILGMISEIVHHFFLSSPFDINDIIATIATSIIFALLSVKYERSEIYEKA